MIFRYANRAKNIKNKPKINEDPKDALLREFQEEISRLKQALSGKGPKKKKGHRKRRGPDGKISCHLAGISQSVMLSVMKTNKAEVMH